MVCPSANIFDEALVTPLLLRHSSILSGPHFTFSLPLVAEPAIVLRFFHGGLGLQCTPQLMVYILGVPKKVAP